MQKFLRRTKMIRVKEFLTDHEHGQAVYAYEYQRGIINSRYELVSRTALKLMN